MKTLAILFLSTLSVFSFKIVAQFNTNYEFLSMSPTVGVGIGSSAYFGDLSIDEEFSAAKSSTTGFNLFYHHPISPSFVGVANLNYNRLSHWGVDSSIVRNFKTKVYGLDVGARYRLDNDIIFDQQKSLTVFVGAGFGLNTFNIYEDLKSKDNADYHFWSDGTVRNLSESDPNSSTAVQISRDYVYETEQSSAKSLFPSTYLELGFGLKITHNLTANFAYKHNFTFTDELDNVTSNSKKDKFNYWNVSLAWSFGKPYRTADEILRDKTAETIDQDDMDEDGIADINDNCPKTELGWEVDEKGCPLDLDKDDVPDAIDKELDSKKDAFVNSEGVTLTGEEIEVNYLLQTGQMSGHERSAEWKAKYPALFAKYYSTSNSVNKSESEE
jgi:hypothetical protein